ncbi:MAG: hypothetical protein A2V65_04970 [Deltaproteobacteria bacterium RBG_13_49_15]|nr:MAG: hypothetical protein A2V65_04970 [Deltaproteobacteria bacterium RBG_13_49_15]
MDALRISSIKRKKPISVLVNGKKVIAYQGEMVHAVLLSAGYRVLRKTRNQKGRSLFCGMGVCYDCLVTVNGVPGQRACMTEVHDQMEITILES